MSGRVQKERRPDKPVTRERGAVTKAFAAVATLVFAVFIALGVSIALECVGIALKWWPADHAMKLLIAERGYIEAIDNYPLTALSPLAVSNVAAGEFDSLWQALWSPGGLSDYATGSINAVKLVLLRIIITLFTLPGFLLVAFIAFFDDLVARDIRKYTGGHESSYVFHKAKRWVVPSLVLTISIYLMLPFSLPPVVIFAPSMALTGTMIYVATSRFKKYL